MADRARLRALICRKMLATMATSSTQNPTNSMPPRKKGPAWWSGHRQTGRRR